MMENDKKRGNPRRYEQKKPQRRGPRLVEIPENPTEEDRERLLARAMFTCMWHLDRSPKTRQQLHDKLAAKAFTPEYIEPTLERLEELELINDEEYARDFLESRVNRGQGFARIQRDLMMRGVSREIIENTIAVAQEDKPDADAENAYNFAFKKAMSHPAGLEHQKRMQRLVGAMTRQGFREDVFSIARRAIEDSDTER